MASFTSVDDELILSVPDKGETIDIALSGNHTIVAPSASTSFIGGCAISTDIGGVTIIANTADDTITMNGSTTGGILGTFFRFTDVASGIFMIEGFLCASGAEADPFSAGVS